MNEQQLQQIVAIQQAIAAAATAAVINSLLNPQQAAGLANANALTDTSNDLQHQQQQENRQSPTATAECNNRIQDLLLQLQQQASVGQSPLNLNLSTQSVGSNLTGSPIRSPVNRLTAQELNSTPTTSNTQQQSSQQQASPIKKLKRHHHQQQTFHNRSSEATSKPQHSSPKNHSTISSLSGRNISNNIGNNNTSSSSSSSAFIPNNVGLPRKLVRGQDVWLGRGAEQTRQILKCMWCGQSFRTLAEMTQHMKITQHYTNIISQEQITSWRQPESADVNSKHSSGNKQSLHVRNLDDNHDDSSDNKFNDSDREDNFSNDDDLEQHKHRQTHLSNNTKSDSFDNTSTTGSIQDDSINSPTKSLSSSKPLTRSRKRETEAHPTSKQRDVVVRDKSPTTSSSSQQKCSQNSSSNLILAESNEGSETNKESCRTNGNSQEIPEVIAAVAAAVAEAEATIADQDEKCKDRDSEDSESELNQESQKDDENRIPNGDSITKAKLKSKSARDDSDDADGEDDIKEELDEIVDEAVKDDADGGDIDNDGQTSETNESIASTTTSGIKSSTGDPLSALETMVEKSFDPRMRPGVANGGILQRLGIDEEVCPPWQHINYANWYAAAAYGHPMAAALMAASINNLQNGIKLSKNIDSKKSED